MAASTRSRVVGETSATPRTTLDTVDFETPASAATSKIVAGLRGSGAVSLRAGACAALMSAGPRAQ